MAKQGDTPDLSQSPRDREVLKEIARLIKTTDADDGPDPGSSALADAEDPEEDDDTSENRDAGAATGSLDLDFVARLLDAMPAGVALCTTDAIVCANAPFALAFGYRSGEDLIVAGGLPTLFPGQTNRDAFPPRGGLARAIWTATTQSGRRVEMPIAGQRLGDGATAYWLLTLHPAPGRADQPDATSDDKAGGLDETKASHEAQGEPRDQAAVSAPDTAAWVPLLTSLAAIRGQGVVRLDRENRIHEADDRAATLLGTSVAELRGLAFDTLFAAADKASLQSAMVRIGDDQAGQASRCALRLQRADDDAPALQIDLVSVHGTPDHPLWAFVEVVPGPQPSDNADGEPRPPSLILGVSPSNLEMLAKISHEIRTPLNSIIGFAEFMREERLGPIGNVKYRGYLDDIYESGQYALSLINDLLDLSKVESGNFSPNFTAVDANEVISECVNLIQPMAQNDRVVVRMALLPDAPLILADRRSLKQIALNLLSNSVKFTEAGGQVIAATSLERDGALKITVRDTGVGMSEAEIEQAMTPFRQLDTAPRQQVGTGLGLPLSKALVEANRATMHVRSRRGSGTRIDVTFPADRIAGQEP